jgi:hypothetical protein
MMTRRVTLAEKAGFKKGWKYQYVGRSTPDYKKGEYYEFWFDDMTDCPAFWAEDDYHYVGLNKFDVTSGIPAGDPVNWTKLCSTYPLQTSRISNRQCWEIGELRAIEKKVDTGYVHMRLGGGKERISVIKYEDIPKLVLALMDIYKNGEK